MTAADFTFTDHVRHFGTPKDRTEEVLPKIRQTLRQIMRNRGILSESPRWLGYDESSWDRMDDHADIVHDAYDFAILSRLPSLKIQLLVKPNVEGLVKRNIKNFLWERQKKFDRIGHAVFSNLRNAWESLEALGECPRVMAESERWDEACIQFGPASLSSPATVERLEVLLHDCLDWLEVLPSLVKCSQKGADWCIAFLRRLPAAGVTHVLVSDLVKAIATLARADWKRPNDTGPDFVQLFGQATTLFSFEVDDHWQWFKWKMRQEIDQYRAQQRVRDGLSRVFQLLVTEVEAGNFDTLNQASVAQRLDLPPQTVHDHFQKLREIALRVVSDGK